MTLPRNLCDPSFLMFLDLYNPLPLSMVRTFDSFLKSMPKMRGCQSHNYIC